MQPTEPSTSALRPSPTASSSPSSSSSQPQQQYVIVVGAGLAGSLLALTMSKRGFKVDVFERREDIRTAELVEGRSINLALSTRGITALASAGLGHLGKELGTPMFGRIVHPEEDSEGRTQFQQYGVRPEQHLLSISRTVLNERLIDAAEAAGAKFHFKIRCLNIDFDTNTIHLVDENDGPKRGEEHKIKADVIFGADGAFSAVRLSMQMRPYFDYSQQYLDHAYKELTMPPGADGGYQLASNGLHIWPRGDFMMIGLPNLDKSFTITLFMPIKQFEVLKTKEDVRTFFRKHFPDAMAKMPNFEEQFFRNPTGSLVWVKCEPFDRGHTVLLGDAAHAIVPFYGQGMNCCFEDVRILNELLDKHNNDFDKVIPMFGKTRKRNTDAISDLSHRNYMEMRSHVAHSDYLLRKKLDTWLNYIMPDSWIPLYSMVTFSNIPYAEVVERAAAQDEVVRKAKVVLPLALVAASGIAAFYLPQTRPYVHRLTGGRL